MPFNADAKRYLREYQREYEASVRGGQHTGELSFRTPIDTFFKNLASDFHPDGNCEVILEPRSQGRAGRPDWRIQDSVSLGVYGYIDGKSPSMDVFDTAPYQAQISRYLTLGHKFIITDGIEFVFYLNETPVRVSIVDKNQLRTGVRGWDNLTIDQNFRFYMEQFFSAPSPQQLDEERLVELVAVRTRNLAEDILEKINLEEDEALDDEERNVIRLLSGLRNLVYNHNDPTLRTGIVFSDFVAQVIMFCLLYAHRVFCREEDTPGERARKIREYAFGDTAEREALIPFHNLMVYLRDHNGEETFIGQWVDECITFLSFVQMTENQLTNPDYHRLFELFLEKFDKQARFDYGAFYTPKVLADFIVRLTNEIVDECFDGATIYDDGNTIIDPCCGTGSFLERIISQDNGNNDYNLCGIEILPAPYMLANYRLALLEGRHDRHDMNTNIILANTLSNCVLGEGANPRSIEGEELIRAKELSSRPITLIIGNPPCSDAVRNNVSNDFSIIISLMEDFRPPLEERSSRQNVQKQINNPFMQFLRWSCEKLLCTNNHSALALVVPLSFLEAVSYKYARKYLAEHFNRIWAVAIDADARTGVRGDSMFYTLQGRAVILLTRKYGDDRPATSVSYMDISRGTLQEKQAVLEAEVNMDAFETFAVTDNMYSFMPSKPFNEDLYNKFWPVSNNSGKTIFLNQCSGAKMAPTALLTHVKKPMLKRRSREINIGGIPTAEEWIGKQDKKVDGSKILAFQQALQTCTSPIILNRVLGENIHPCSFRPFVNSYAFLWDTIFEYQAGVGGGGARIRPEIKAVYDRTDTIGFSLAHAPKDLSESLGQFASFCWYFPDNDLSRRGNGHIYLNQYITNTRTGTITNNISTEILEHLISMTGINARECSQKMVFYAYAVFCSQVFLDEFYGALFVVNQAETRARIPIVSDCDIFLELADLGRQLALLEKNNADVENILEYDYDTFLADLPDNFKLEHTRAAARSPYDEENEEVIIRDRESGEEMRIYCPVAIQRFTVSGYNVVKDCWLKFHSYRYTHCTFTREDLRELLDLFNKIMMQMRIVEEIDGVMHQIIDGQISILDFYDE